MREDKNRREEERKKEQMEEKLINITHTISEQNIERKTNTEIKENRSRLID